MRVTANMSSDNALYNIQKGRAKLDKLNESISSGQNVNRPSDDPISARLLLDVGDKLQALDQYTSNITKGQTWLKYTSTALQGMTDTLKQAKKLAGSISSGSSDPSIRQSVHDQLVELKNQLVDMGNTQLGDQYIFAGSNNGTAPFNKLNNTYAGNSDQMPIEITSNASQNIGITGDRLLLGQNTASIPPVASPNYGSTDILKAFDDLITAVGDTSTASNVAGITAASVDITNGSTQLQIATSDLLARTTRLTNMAALNTNNKNTLNTIVSNVQTVDYAKLGVEMTQQTTAFQASLSSTAKLTQMSLLDYLS